MSSDMSSVGNPREVTTSEKPYICDICGLGCHTSMNLKSHMLFHRVKRPHQCSFCHKCYKRRSYLTNHLRTHAGEKLFSCGICEERFHQASLLKRHTHMHVQNGEMPHRCMFCPKAFKIMCELKIHLRMHTNEKPYVCEFCQRAFRRRQNLDAHRLSHMEDKPYSCSVCSKQFCQKGVLQKHERTQHGPKKVRPAVTNLPFRKICPKPCLMTATTVKLPLPLAVKEIPQAVPNETPQQKVAKWMSIFLANQNPKSDETVPKAPRTQKEMCAASPKTPEKVIQSPQQKMAQWRSVFLPNHKPKSNQIVSKVPATQNERCAPASKTPKKVIQSEKLSLAFAPKSPVAPSTAVPLAPVVMFVTCQTRQVVL